MIYIQLYPSSRFEFYGKEGIIFDLLGNNRYKINQENAIAFHDLISGREYKHEEYSSSFNEMLLSMLNDGIIYTYNTPKYHEELRFHNIFEINLEIMNIITNIQDAV